MECRNGNDNDDYLYLDPKLLKRGDTMPKTRAPFQDAIVFVVGGGNYIEYQNLVDFIKVSKFVHAPQNDIYDNRIRVDGLIKNIFNFLFSAKAHAKHKQTYYLWCINVS